VAPRKDSSSQGIAETGKIDSGWVAEWAIAAVLTAIVGLGQECRIGLVFLSDSASRPLEPKWPFMAENDTQFCQAFPPLASRQACT
jgi:hypothetical protein